MENKQNEKNSAESIKGRLIDFFIKEMIDPIIGNEIMYGVRRKVVDLLILNQNRLYAVEIKGENDSLKRLREQIEEYKKVFNYIIVCTTDSHLNQIKEFISDDIGIYLIKNNQIIIKRLPKLQKKLDKTEMLYTMNSRYLKQNNKILGEFNSDEVRDFYKTKSIKTIQTLLYSYFFSKIESKYKLFLSEKGKETHIDDIPTLSSQIDIL